MLKSTNQRIIRATMDLLTEKGYQKTTTKEIATKANVSEATIFRNFKNKRGVIAAIMKMKSTPTKNPRSRIQRRFIHRFEVSRYLFP